MNIQDEAELIAGFVHTRLKEYGGEFLIIIDDNFIDIYHNDQNIYEVLRQALEDEINESLKLPENKKLLRKLKGALK
jgi:hypothetical protein